MIGCQSCGHSNRAGARFCTGCGQALELRCAACGAAVFADERFCAECGAPLVQHPIAVAPASERKQVTVLFADVANSMDLAESLGADRLGELMHRLFAVCQSAVTAFDGTVDKFTGDGVLVLFGAPVAIEDHPVRACHAALRLVADAAAYAAELRADGIELAVRVGCNSGEVVAGAPRLPPASATGRGYPSSPRNRPASPNASRPNSSAVPGLGEPSDSVRIHRRRFLRARSRGNG